VTGAESDLEQLKKEVATLKEKHQNAAIQCGKYKSELEKEQSSVKEQTEQNSTLKAQIEQIEAQLTELKGQKDTAEEQNKKLQEENETTQQRLAELSDKITQLESSLKSKDDEISNEKSAHEERQNKIAELEQHIKDLQMQHTIAEKQNINMVKQLQAQIKALQAAAPPSPSINLSASGSITPTLHRTSSNFGHRRENSTGGASSRSSAEFDRPTPTPSPRKSTDNSGTSTPTYNPGLVAPVIAITASQVHNSAPTAHVMQKDIEILGVRLGQLQERNFFLEEKMNVYKDTINELSIEIDKKSRLIQKQQLMLKGANMAQQPSTSTPAQSGALFSSPRKDALENEKFSKMGSVMEETLLKNMQLQEDIKTLGNEVEVLMAENDKLKKILAEKK
jgi:chromosome segregation ATPase